MSSGIINGDIREYLFPHLATSPLNECTRGDGINGGAIAGEVIFSAEKARGVASPIFFHYDRNPQEVESIYASNGYVTLTKMAPGAHPVILSKIKGIPVIMNAKGRFREGEAVTIDGITGKIYRGQLEIREAKEIPKKLEELLDNIERPRVRSLMVLPDDPVPFTRFNCEGVGPFATEYMFYQNGQLEAFQRLILLGDRESKNLINKYQKESFCKILKMANGKPVAIRYFDPPLHEFLPSTATSIDALAEKLNIPSQELGTRVNDLREENPAFGYRGSRIGIVQSDIYRMQTEVIFEAVEEVQNAGFTVDLELIYPLICDHREIDQLNELVLYPVADERRNIKYKLGIMVELPSACLDGAEIAKRVQTISFGTNDLTQTALGISRDDSQHYIDYYISQGIFRRNPFRTLHPQVARLMKIFIDEAKSVNKGLKIGICGAHASDQESLESLESLGVRMDYLSVMPYSVIQTKLAAAGVQAYA